MTEEEISNVQRELVTYRYLAKRAIKFMFEIVIILVLLFHWQQIFNLIQSIYGF